MALQPGTRLGPYEILSAIGAGGMGEVYRARDTRLDRIVAVKVVSSSLVGAPDLRERFDREARAVAALNHPHICTLHDVGHEGGVDFLVMEHLEGETLADRLTRGALPIADVVRLGVEIADALDRAHRAGIVHRDLKPANVFLTKAGAKLLDFGLAKHATVTTAGPHSIMPTTPATLTAAGTILGTFQYMAPEQLEGAEADARTDIFSFGALLYEMAAGRKAFEGKTQASLIASIIGKEPPPLSNVQPVVPPGLERIVRIAMAKDPDDRWQSARDLARELKDLTQGPAELASKSSAPVVVSAHPRTGRREVLAWTLAAVGLGAALVAGLRLMNIASAPAAVTRFTVSAPPNTEFTSNTILSVSPDGRYIVFMAGSPNEPANLWLRSFDATEATLIAGTRGAGVPFWSPDSRFIGFFADNKLKKVALGGGPPLVLADAAVTGNNRGGGAWSRDDLIVFQPSNNGPLFRVSAAGGEPSAVTTLDESRKETVHRYPTFLPDGKHFLYVAQPGGSIIVASLDSPETKRLMQADSKPVFAPPDHLLFIRQNVLLAQRFDTRQLQLVGDAVPLGQQVRSNPPFGSAAFSVSDNGVLAYGSGSATLTTQLEWVDRSGQSRAAVEGNYDYRSVGLSPDGKQTIAHRHEDAGGGGLWLTDLERAATTRFTLTQSHDANAVYSPDGTRVAFMSDRDERDAIFVKPANGTGSETLLLKAPDPTRPTDWSSDGRWLAYSVVTPKSMDIWLLPLAGNQKPVAVATTDFEEGGLQFSPDGRYVAYFSNESRRYEIYLQSMASGGGKWQVSTNGGIYPRWRADGGELYYLDASVTMMAVEVDLRSAPPRLGAPRALFQSRAALQLGGAHTYAVAPDGMRFLIARLPAQVPATLTVVLNWTAALPR